MAHGVNWANADTVYSSDICIESALYISLFSLRLLAPLRCTVSRYLYLHTTYYPVLSIAAVSQDHHTVLCQLNCFAVTVTFAQLVPLARSRLLAPRIAINFAVTKTSD